MKLPLLACAAAAASLALAPMAHADQNIEIVSPSGNITCVMLYFGGKNSANCQIKDFSYAIERDCSATAGPGWHRGDNWHLDEGDTALPTTACHNGQNVGYPTTLPYGQSKTLGALICTSETTGVRCTDNSTGHFFRVSRESYQIG
jgi:hypothetical protein